MQIIDYSHTQTSSASTPKNSPLLETLTAAMIFLLPALILFIFAAN